MEKIVKVPNKRLQRYRSAKQTISISLDPDLVEYLDRTAENIGSDRSKIISFALEQAKNWEDQLPTLLRSLQTLGLKPSKKMRTALSKNEGDASS